MNIVRKTTNSVTIIVKCLTVMVTLFCTLTKPVIIGTNSAKLRSNVMISFTKSSPIDRQCS